MKKRNEEGVANVSLLNVFFFTFYFIIHLKILPFASVISFMKVFYFKRIDKIKCIYVSLTIRMKKKNEDILILNFVFLVALLLTCNSYHVVIIIHCDRNFIVLRIQIHKFKHKSKKVGQH